MKFCPSCGKALYEDQKLPTTRDFFHEFINYDPAIWQSLKTLIIKPGALTGQFLKGDHKKVTSPAKLFILVSTIAFLIGTVSVIGEKENMEQALEKPPVLAEKPPLELEVETSTGIRINNIEYYRDEIDSLGVDIFLQQRESTPGPVTYWIVKRTLEKYQENDYEEINKNFERNASFLLYLLIPIFALLLKLVQRKKSFTEHLSFTLYFFSVFYLIQLIEKGVSRLLITFITGPWIGYLFIPWIWIVGYLIIAIRRHYEFGWLRAFITGIIIGALFLVSVALLLFLASLLILPL